jgi:hypothetical protein
MAKGNDLNPGSVANRTMDPSSAKDSREKLFSPNAQEDTETVSGDNPQKPWMPGGGKPSGPFGPQGREF